MNHIPRHLLRGCLAPLLLCASAHAADRIDTCTYDLKEGDLRTQGTAWTASGGGVVSPAEGFQFTYPNRFSALKTFTVEATVSKLVGTPKAAVGLHVGIHMGLPLEGWNFLYTSATGEFRFEFRSPQHTKLYTTKVQKVDFPIRLKLDVDSNAKHWTLLANDLEIFRLPTEDLPVLWESGVCSLDGAAEVTALHITAGDFWKPVIAAGDSITHHCGWTQSVSAASGVAIGNAGMACDTTSGVVKRLDTDVIGLHPKCVVLFIGTNDPDAKSACANYPVMLDRLKEAGIQPILCTALPREGTEKINRINDFLRQLAQDRRVPLVDWHDALLGEKPREMDPKYWLGGPVHPNSAAVEIMTRLFLANEQAAAIFRRCKDAAAPVDTP